jgi:hypothetical protein
VQVDIVDFTYPGIDASGNGQVDKEDVRPGAADLNFPNLLFVQDERVRIYARKDQVGFKKKGRKTGQRESRSAVSLHDVLRPFQGAVYHQGAIGAALPDRPQGEFAGLSGSNDENRHSP